VKFKMEKTIAVLMACFLLGTVTAHADRPFPKDQWLTGTPESVGIDSSKLQALDDYVFADMGIARMSDALLVIKGGTLVYEKYGYGYNPTMRHISWSMAKSVTSLLFGIAESEGLISRNSKMVDFYNYPAATPEQQAMKNKITMYNLLTMSSGIDWLEAYTKSSALQSDVTQMLYLGAQEDMAAYVASRPMKYEPGDDYYYSSGNTNVVMGALKQTMKTEDYNNYPWTRLFDKIGMKNVVFEQDGAGTFSGASYVYATAQDYARLGYLLLNGGKWESNTIVPSEWLTLATQTLSPGFSTATQDPNEVNTYGAGFWLNLAAPKFNLPIPFPAAPADMFYFLGHNGQMIFVIPSRDIVAVRLGHEDGDDGLDRDQFMKLLLESVKN